MTEQLSRQLNALGAIAIAIVLAFGFYAQFVAGELPCPLCLLQRVGFVAVMFGLICNVIYGPRPVHYAIMIFAALFGAAVALRQVALHVIPGTPYYGDAFFAYHFYTWAFITFSIIIFGTTVMLSFSSQYQAPRFQALKSMPILSKLAVISVLLITLLNVLSTFAECGPFQCPDNPVSYWLLSYTN
ncbi:MULTISPECIES: disulfide bond formation protein B [Shewanella]|uniref:Disulfide bond formation protein B n=1 Tax=Shewanella fidelis TaxID=173509 RepID=A0AAW8NIZ7_9GAMM|nr:MULTISPECIES: disulfide bond formation protein B [Shewanella]MDR8523292.1 disulfide bond formation protein B [Shewanella fidelis]MDW4811382.1 disulfide bond formation protein B [Shewanella fidelis]MDW4815503.1 disulfide bond formation protein B [Shewanella fidelis]MDW4819593.1 disulfide bond formation protein B [Shewanella fidelis]MDW4824433.1 disulfide bond formation protein B [Shewanella fidelis]